MNPIWTICTECGDTSASWAWRTAMPGVMFCSSACADIAIENGGPALVRIG